MADSTLYGSFIPTTYTFDVSELYEVDVNSIQFKELLVRLYQNVNSINLSMNTRDAGYYNNTEFVNGQLWFPNPALSSQTAQAPTFRQVFRKVIDFGALPNNTTKSVAHGITIATLTNATVSATRIYGAATDPIVMSYVPLPYASATGNNIELNFDATNVNVTTNSDWTAYTICYIVLEYIKE